MKNLILLLALMLTGCATIVDGRSDTISLMTSNGSQVNANVYSRTGGQQLILPAMIQVPKSCSDITVQVLEDDKVRQSGTIVSSRINPWTFGNLIFGWLLGFAIDGLSGNICTYDNTALVPVYSK